MTSRRTSLRRPVSWGARPGRRPGCRRTRRYSLLALEACRARGTRRRARVRSGRCKWPFATPRSARSGIPRRSWTGAGVRRTRESAGRTRARAGTIRTRSARPARRAPGSIDPSRGGTPGPRGTRNEAREPGLRGTGAWSGRESTRARFPAARTWRGRGPIRAPARRPWTGRRPPRRGGGRTAGRFARAPETAAPPSCGPICRWASASRPRRPTIAPGPAGLRG